MTDTNRIRFAYRSQLDEALEESSMGRTYRNQREYDSAEAEDVLDGIREARLREVKDAIREEIEDLEWQLKDAKQRLADVLEDLGENE